MNLNAPQLGDRKKKKRGKGGQGFDSSLFVHFVGQERKIENKMFHLPDDPAKRQRLTGMFATLAAAPDRPLSVKTLEDLSGLIIWLRNQNVAMPATGQVSDPLLASVSELYTKRPDVRAETERRYSPELFPAYLSGAHALPAPGTPEDAKMAQFVRNVGQTIVDETQEKHRVSRHDLNGLISKMISGKVRPPVAGSETAAAIAEYANIPSVRDLFIRLFEMKERVTNDKEYRDFVVGIKSYGAGTDAAEMASDALGGKPGKEGKKLVWNPFEKARSSVPKELMPYSDDFERMLRSPGWEEQMRSGFLTALKGLYEQVPKVSPGDTIDAPEFDPNPEHFYLTVVKAFLSRSYKQAGSRIAQISKDKKMITSIKQRELRMYANALWALASYGACDMKQNGDSFTFSARQDGAQHLAMHAMKAVGKYDAATGAQIEAYLAGFKKLGVKSPESAVTLVANRLRVMPKMPTTPEELKKMFAEKKQKKGKEAKPQREKKEKQPNTPEYRVEKIEKSTSYVLYIAERALKIRKLKQEGKWDPEGKGIEAVEPGSKGKQPMHREKATLVNIRALAERVRGELSGKKRDAYEKAGLVDRLTTVLQICDGFVAHIGKEAPKDDAGLVALGQHLAATVLNPADAATGAFLEQARATLAPLNRSPKQGKEKEEKK